MKTFVFPAIKPRIAFMGCFSYILNPRYCALFGAEHSAYKGGTHGPRSQIIQYPTVKTPWDYFAHRSALDFLFVWCLHGGLYIV